VIATILSSSDSAPLSSVMICWNTIATTLNMSFRDELLIFGAWTDLVLAAVVPQERQGRPV
jgi:hypothetical protein